MLPLVLASASPNRKLLLERLKMPFIVQPANIDESIQSGESADDLVLRLAQNKAMAVQTQFPDHSLITSDQVAVLNYQQADEMIFGKPGNLDNAFKQLTIFSGKSITFLTSLCLMIPSQNFNETVIEPFHVQFKKLSAQTITHYLNQEDPSHCAGSFKSEGLGISLVEKMTGDDPNALLGLPLIQLCKLFQLAGIHITPKH